MPRRAVYLIEAKLAVMDLKRKANANGMQYHERRGFTLIELLVVVSIIALLVSILLPALGKAREQAKGVVCRTRLSQLGLGYHSYATENDGNIAIQRSSIPHLYRDSSNNWCGIGLLYDKGYIGNAHDLDCPNRKPMLPAYLASYSIRPFRNRGGGGWKWYGYEGDWTTVGPLHPLKIAKIRSPSSLSLLADLLYSYDDIYLLHKNCWNMLFVDGHIEQVVEKDDTLMNHMLAKPPYWNGVNSAFACFSYLEEYAQGVAHSDY